MTFALHHTKEKFRNIQVSSTRFANILKKMSFRKINVFHFYIIKNYNKEYVLHIQHFVKILNKQIYIYN